MINITGRPIVLAEGHELDRRIRSGINKFLEALDKKYVIQSKLLVYTNNIKNGFGSYPAMACYIYFSAENLLDDSYGDAFIQALMDVADINSRNEGITVAFSNLHRFLKHNKPLPAIVSSKIKGFIRLLLFVLWGEKAIVLPYRFHLGGSALIEHQLIISSIESELATFFRKYKYIPDTHTSDATSLPRSGAETIYKYGPRLIWATDYHRFEDVQITELSQLYKSITISDKGEWIGKSTPPLALMLRELLNYQPNRLSYTASDVDQFTLWSNWSSANKYTFEEFLARKPQILEEIQIKRMGSKTLPDEARAQVKSNFGVNSQPNNIDELLSLTVKDDHISIVEYFSKIRGISRNGIGWLRHKAPYVGREHIDLQSISSLWVESWTAWLKYRKSIQGYDTESGQYRAFNIFCDYLFLYLPWWKELFPDNDVNIPLSPNQLKRSTFIHRTQLYDGEPAPIEKLPLTFLDIISFRLQSADSRYSTIIQLIQYLDWVEVGFEDDDRIAGKGYRNPIKRIDLPRVQKKTKTTKIPFSKRVYPHLLYYCYAIEAFGEYLQTVAMDRPFLFEGKHIRQQKFLSTGPLPNQVDNLGRVSEEYLEDWPDSFGYVPYISYRGKNFPIYRMPDVFQWSKRSVDLSRYNITPNIVCSRWIPHLTLLRLLMGAVETGLRLQSIQWLDLRSWDSLNKRNGVPPSYSFNMSDSANGKFILPLYVPTDKSKEEAWDTSITFRLRACFYREQYFRDSIIEPDMDMPVDYDGIENSRFGKILPLFRSQRSPKPISDSNYFDYWVHLLWGFEEYFDNNVSTENEFIQFVYLRGTDKEVVRDYSETDINELLAISTPHACRATYATNKTGILEVSEVARQLGQQNTVVTAHYTVSTPEIMAAKLEVIEKEILASFGTNSNPSYIRADDINGELYQGFQSNRLEAIKSFQFAPAISLWNTAELNSDLDGIDLLKNSPMSQIVFRETHICPVGEKCPDDIVAQIIEPKRCGLCPLAMRCVDHLPAIAAKINQLTMIVRAEIRRAEQMADRKEPDSAIDPFYEAAESHASEIVGWQLSQDILLRMLEINNKSQNEYHTHSPEIVKKHLQVVSSNRSLSAFFLQRISDANAYPSMGDPEIQRVADRYCRYILSEKNQPTLEQDPVMLLAGYIKTHLEPLGLTINDLAERIDELEQAKNEKAPLLSSTKAFFLNNSESVE